MIRKVYVKSILVLIGSFIISGCSSIKYSQFDSDINRQRLDKSGLIQKHEIFKDEIHKEKVFKAARNYNELISLYKEKLSKNDDFGTRYKLAQYYYEARDFISAKYYLAPLVDIDYSMEALLLNAKILKEQKKDLEALSSLESALELEKSDKKNEQYITNKQLLGYVYNLSGIICSQNNLFDEAKGYFFKAKDLFVEDRVINTNLGFLALLQMDYKKAVDYLSALYLRGDKEPKILNNLLFALVKDGQKQKALSLIKLENLSKDANVFIKNLEKLDIKYTNKISVSEEIKEKCLTLDTKKKI